MYQDAGYGENWQPERNHARRIDPYTRSCIIFISFSAIGFVFIIILVLSLIPIYISHNNSSPTNNSIQVLKGHVSDYTLQFQSPSDDFNSTIFLSQLNYIQATLTSMIQNDSILTGSVIQIANPSISSKQISKIYNITFDLSLTSNTSCTSSTCSQQFQIHMINQLSRIITPVVRYDQLSQIYWIEYQLPANINPQISIVNIDIKSMSLLLEKLLNLTKNSNHELITSTLNIFG